MNRKTFYYCVVKPDGRLSVSQAIIAESEADVIAYLNDGQPYRIFDSKQAYTEEKKVLEAAYQERKTRENVFDRNSISCFAKTILETLEEEHLYRKVTFKSQAEQLHLFENEFLPYYVYYSPSFGYFASLENLKDNINDFVQSGCNGDDDRGYFIYDVRTGHRVKIIVKEIEVEKYYR